MGKRGWRERGSDVDSGVEGIERGSDVDSGVEGTEIERGSNVDSDVEENRSEKCHSARRPLSPN